MARPKGSKNKPKVIGDPIVTPKKEEVLEKVEAPKEDWKPAPDMGRKIPPPETKPCENQKCSHQRRMHYGGESEWCNAHGCNCQAWVE